jgi:putative membrane protein insertion efficiency factor
MVKKIVLAILRIYHSISAVFGPACRFTPTCSEYTYQAIEKYGIAKGSWMGLKRISRCHPWSKGGPDPLP